MKFRLLAAATAAALFAGEASAQRRPVRDFLFGVPSAGGCPNGQCPAAPVAAAAATTVAAPAPAPAPVTAGHWTFPGPRTKAGIIAHLLAEPQHAGRTAAQLEAMTFEQLLSLHDADHESLRAAAVRPTSSYSYSVAASYTETGTGRPAVFPRARAAVRRLVGR